MSHVAASSLVGALLLTSSVALADGAPAPPALGGIADPCGEADVDADDRRAAKGLHRAAEAYFRDARYREALDAWRDAYRHDCSAHLLLINIANSLDRLGRVREAALAFEAFITREKLRMPQEDEGPPHPAFLRLAELRARADDPAPAPALAPEPLPPPAPAPEPSLLPWIFTAAGGVTALAGVGLMVGGAVVQQGAHDDCDAAGTCPASAVDEGRLAVHLQQGGGVAAFAGLALAAAGGLWLLLEEDTPASGVDLEVGLGRAGLRLRF